MVAMGDKNSTETDQPGSQTQDNNLNNTNHTISPSPSSSSNPVPIKPQSVFKLSLIRHLPSHLLATFILLLIGFIHLCSLYIFSQGFLLSRLTINNRSYCDPTSTTTTPCFIEPTHSKAIIILIDALRYDFLLPHHTDLITQPHVHNHLTLPAQLTKSQPQNSALYHFVADAPTTTLQRLKGLTTGTLPTFIDAGSNFASVNMGIEEDSWIHQLKSIGKVIGFAGDDTWMNLFGSSPSTDIGSASQYSQQQTGFFHPNLTFPFESFNVEDLDTVDAGVEHHLLKMMMSSKDPNNSDKQVDQHWDILIGHFLGLDHAGHRFGPSHPSMTTKLSQYNEFLQTIVDQLEEDTLLIVMGDHGMDSKGDHGGDSFLEVSSALWLYSKTKPLIPLPGTLPDWLWTESDFIELEPSLGKVRTVPQIDLVPTISLLLGSPIPFSNLGMIIPELFYRPMTDTSSTASRARKVQSYSSLESLALSTSINSAQLLSFIETYAGTSDAPGQDLAPRVPELRELHAQGIKFYENQEFEKSFQAYRQFGFRLLSHSRTIWASFNPTLMFIGILILGLSVLASFRLMDSTKWTTAGSAAPIRLMTVTGVWVGLLGSLIGLVISLLKLTSTSLVSNLLIGSSTGICLGIIFYQSASPICNLKTCLKETCPSFGSLASVIPLILHALTTGSNSYTVWEDKAVLYLISICVLLPILNQSFNAPQSRLRNRLFFFTILFAVCARMISTSTVCREEQYPFCSITFYSSSTSSSAPNWVMTILIPLAICVPIGLAWFLGIADSYRGPASIFFGSGVRLSLLCGVQYWISDYIISNGDLSTNPGLRETGKWVKTLVARFDLVLCLLGGTLVWFLFPLCIDVQREENEGTEKGGKPKVLVIGFANSYGSSYLMFLASAFCVLFLVAQPTGQLILSISLIAILTLVEINDSLNDVKSLRVSFESAVNAAAQQKPRSQIKENSRIEEEPIKVESTRFLLISGLSLLGYLIFFGTGHQATFSSIQWKTGFIGFNTANYLWSPVLIGLNTLSGFVITSLSIPLFRIWNFSPMISTQSKPSNEKPQGIQIGLISSILKDSLKFMMYHVMICLSCMISCSVLRRHLMVWKIFGPRFMLQVLIVLGSDVCLSLFCFGWGVGISMRKVRRAFGTRSV